MSVVQLYRGDDGESPFAGLVRDHLGNLYGTASGSGEFGCGTVFKLDQTGEVTELYSFRGDLDGALPYARVVLDGRGNLYGVAQSGGSGASYGTIFKWILRVTRLSFTRLPEALLENIPSPG